MLHVSAYEATSIFAEPQCGAEDHVRAQNHSSTSRQQAQDGGSRDAASEGSHGEAEELSGV